MSAHVNTSGHNNLSGQHIRSRCQTYQGMWIYQGMSTDMSGHVDRNIMVRLQTYQGMSTDISGRIDRHIRACLQTYHSTSIDISGQTYGCNQSTSQWRGALPGGGVKGKSYIWLGLNFALFIFCNNGGARKALVSGIVGGGAQWKPNPLWLFFKFLKASQLCFIHFFVKKLVTSIIKGVRDVWEQKVSVSYKFHAYVELSNIVGWSLLSVKSQHFGMT